MHVPEMRKFLHIHGPAGYILPSFLHLLLSNRHNNSDYMLLRIHVIFDSAVGVLHRPYTKTSYYFKYSTYNKFPFRFAHKPILLNIIETTQNLTLRSHLVVVKNYSILHCPIVLVFMNVAIEYILFLFLKWFETAKYVSCLSST